MKRDWENFFKPEDFDDDELMNMRGTLYSDLSFSRRIATFANAKLRKALDEAPTVYGTISGPMNDDGMVFLNCTVYPEQAQCPIKSARLVQIKEIK